MSFFSKTPNFKFMEKRFIALAFSGVIILAGIFMFVTRDFNLGVDFTGGTLIEVAFNKPTEVGDLRAKLRDKGVEVQVQRVGERDRFFIKTDKEIKLPEQDKEDNHTAVAESVREALYSGKEKTAMDSKKIDLNRLSESSAISFFRENGILEEEAVVAGKDLIEARNNEKGLLSGYEELEKILEKKQYISIVREKGFIGSFTFLSVEVIGPQVGKDLRKKAALATIFALMGMLLYIAFRFKLVYGWAAVITLTHDILIVLSFILFLNIEVSLTVVAAILTIVGYSLNDTIVIFDRVRENMQNYSAKQSAGEVIDRSINQTLSRTIVTSGTTLLTVLALFFFGGEVIHTFSLTLMIGIIIGTYSSIFQSCTWLMIWRKSFLLEKNKSN